MEQIERFTIDEGVDANGVRKQVTFQDDEYVTKLTFDAEPVLKEAEATRQATEGQRWGEGKVVDEIKTPDSSFEAIVSGDWPAGVYNLACRTN